MVERRQHERVRIRADVTLAQRGRSQRVLARDVSVGGAFLETALHDHIDLRTGSRCQLTLLTDENMALHAAEEGHTIHIQARIVRRDPGGPGRPSGLGVVFEGIDLDNLVRLRALVGGGL